MIFCCSRKILYKGFGEKMSDLNIDIKGVRSLNASISPLISRLSGVERQLNMLKWKVDAQLNAKCNAYERIDYISVNIVEARDDLEKIYRAVAECLEQYMRAEATLYEKTDKIWIE